MRTRSTIQLNYKYINIYISFTLTSEQIIFISVLVTHVNKDPLPEQQGFLVQALNEYLYKWCWSDFDFCRPYMSLERSFLRCGAPAFSLLLDILVVLKILKSVYTL